MDGVVSEALGAGLFSGGILLIIAIILAVAATVLAFIFIIPEKKREGLNPFFRFLHDTFNFKHLLIEKILQVMYVFSTATVILTGFFKLFEFTSFFGVTRWGGGTGLLLMLLGPIVIRLLYEGMMMLVLLVKNVISINSKLGKETSANVFSTPDLTEVKEKLKKEKPAKPVQPVQPIQPIQPIQQEPAQSAPAPQPAEPVRPVQPVQSEPVSAMKPEPVSPVQPVQPVRPEPVQTAPAPQPAEPVRLVQPVQSEPVSAMKPEPVSPVQPIQPVRPEPVQPAPAPQKPEPVRPVQPVQSVQPVQPAAQPKKRFCTQCGARLDESGVCPNCGK